MSAKREPISLVWKKHKYKYLMIAPFALIFIVFTLLPVLVAIFLSFTNFNMVKAPEFAGLDNYVKLMVHDPIFLTAIKNTLFFAIITGPVSYLMCFLFAWMVNDLPRIPRAVMTLVFYAPSISGNAYLVWKLLFSSDSYGWVNAWLMKLGVIQEAVTWLVKKEYIMPILIIVQLWLSLGAGFLALGAGFKTADNTLYEAGAIDGIRNRFQELIYITIPSMKRQMLFAAVMQISSSFAVGNISVQLCGFPSTNYAGHTIMTHIHDFGTVRYDMGYACALSTLLLLIMLIMNKVITTILVEKD